MENLLYGFSVALTPTNLLFGLIGAFLGTLVGVLPGIGPVGSMALLLGLTYKLPPVTALITFAGIYYGSMYGGSTTSILVNIPGESSSVITALDGYQMARKGRGGAALFLAAVGSFVAGTIGLVLLTFLAPQLAELAVKFGPPEFFSIALFGLFVLCQLSDTGLMKSLIMVVCGLMLGTVGLDLFTGQQRMTFGIGALEQGIDFVPVAMGLFGIAEVLESAEKKLGDVQSVIAVKLRDLFPNRSEVERSIGPVWRGSILGFLIGLIPGPAAVISTFISYMVERKLSSHPEEFGKGAPEGVSGPESANNAAAVGAFVPVLSLGIPFAPPTALLLSAMMIHGITPGPLLVQEHPDVFWGVIASMYIGNVMLLALNLPLVGLFVQILRVPLQYLMPGVLLLCVIGAYAVNNSIAHLYLMGIFGILGYALRKLDFPVAPLVLALVIGPMLEDSFRQSLMMSSTEGILILLSSPLSKTLCILAVALVTLPRLWRFLRARRQAAE